MIMDTNRTKGVIDLHIHSGPDVKTRKMNDLELMEAAVRLGVRAVVIKSHHVPTVDRATLTNLICKERYPEANFSMFGGIALNQSVGGLNPYAVESALRLGAKVVWLPTLDAENQCKKDGFGGGIELTRGGKVVPELFPIFDLIRDYDGMLQTGHISAEECFPVVEAARKAGVRKIVVTHPEYHIVGMNIEQQKRIVSDYDVLLELEYAQPVGSVFKSNLADNVEVIRAIGCEHCILATDSGQVTTPFWYDALSDSMDYYYKAGFTAEEMDRMTRKNPGRMLGML